MTYERLWERLLEFLDGWSEATETAPGRLRLAFEDSEGSTRVVEILMSREEWDHLVTIPWGDFDLAAQEVRNAVLGLPDDKRFLVYESYELVPSATPDLPVDPEEARLDELARRHPEGIGRWVALDRDGHVSGELGPPPH